MYWGFLELCNRLQKIGGPQIFNAELKRKITGYIFSEVTLDGNCTSSLINSVYITEKPFQLKKLVKDTMSRTQKK
jgi:hypothetical protein